MGRCSRVTVTGLKGVGKTTLLECAIHANGLTDKEYIPTIEDTYVCSVETDRGTREKLRLFDTAGFELHDSKTLPPHLHAVTDGYLLVYSTKDMNSLQAVIELKKDIDKNKEKKDCVVMVVGTRSDGRLSSVRDAGERWAAVERIRHWDVSVHNRNTLMEPFTELASRLAPAPSKSSLPQFYMGSRKYKD